MSSEVDSRIVQMQFDNKQFESGIKTSLDSLEQLDKSIRDVSSSNGMGGLSTAVETVRTRFSALQVMAVTALANITNSAVNAGKRLLSSLTIDPIKTGLSEYETQINAVQTILANTESKGTTLDQVNTALDTLNAYADKTIYNFTEMTKNIGTFTAAGVDLDTATNAIQGIANLAAVSGSTSQQASTAMYQLSQALSSGTVKLMDWNSVVNAGMGGQVFQDALKETARVHGIAIDDMIESEGSFRETLKNGWLSSDILTETLAKFTMGTEGLTDAEIEANRELLKTQGYTEEQIEAIFKLGNTATNAATKVKTFSQLLDTLKEAAQSGWAQSWEIVIGDFEEAKELWTKVSDTIGAMIGASAQARNAMLQEWKDLGGRTVLIEALGNAFEGIMSIIKPIKEAFTDIFPPATGKQIYGITTALKTATESFKAWAENTDTVDKFKRTFKGLFAILDIGVTIIKAVVGGIANLLGYIAPAGNGLLGFTAALGDVLVKFRDFIKSSNVFSKTIRVIATVLGKVVLVVRSFVDGIADALKAIANVDTSGIDGFTDKVKARFEPLTKLGEGIKKFFSAIVSVLKKVAPIFVTLAGFIGDALGSLADAITNAFTTGDFSAIFDIINGLLSGGILLAIKKFIDSLTGITENVGGTLESFTNIFSGVGDCLKAWQSSLKADTLLKIAGAVAILVASLVVLSLVDSEKLTSAMVGITGLFVELISAMTIFSKVANGKGLTGVTKATAAMTSMSVAILILSFAMKNLAKLDWNGIGKGLVSVASLMAMLVVAANSMEKSSKNLKKSALGMIALSAAILILSEAVEKLGSLDMAALSKGLLGVGVLCAELVLFMKASDMNKLGLSKGLGLLVLAAAINVLANAVSKFGTMDINSLLKGLGAVAVVLAELAIFTKLTGNAKKVISTATGLTILGAAMLIFANAIGKMGSMSLAQIGKGLLTMASALTIVGVAMKLIPKSTIVTATGLVVLASALVILSNALSTMGGMSWEEIGRGMVTLAGALTILTVAMHAMNGTLAGAAAVLVISSALAIFAPVLKSLGSMSWGEIAKGLATIAGVLVIFGVASAALSPVAPVMLAIGAAIALLGVGCAAAGVGVLAFAVGLSTLAVAITAFATSMIVAITSVVSLIPMLVKQLGVLIVAIADGIANAASSILSAATTIIVSVINAIIQAIPLLITCLGTLLDALLGFIITYVPKIVETGVQLIIALLQGIADNIPKVISAALSIITNFLNALAKELPKVVKAGFNIIVSLIEGILDAIATSVLRIIEACVNLGTSIITGLAEGLMAGIKLIVKTITAIGRTIFTAVKKAINTVIDFLWEICNGIPKIVDTIFEMIIRLLNGLADSISRNVPRLMEAGKQLGIALIDGLTGGLASKVQSAVNAVKNIGSKIIGGLRDVLGINSPSKEFAEIGKYSMMGLSGGLTKYTNIVTKSATNVGKSAIDSLNRSLVGISDAVNGNLDTTPTIRPVIDLTDVEAGSKELYDMFDDSGIISVDSANARASAISHSMNSQVGEQSANSQNGASINFTQNNYSPKALSKTDIYRQTKNQISVMKGALQGS